jgi:hypothetical protein
LVSGVGRVLVISGAYFVEYAEKDLGVVNELKRRGHEVMHVVAAEDIPPPFPREAVEQEPAFRAAGSVWKRRLAEAIPFLRRCDVVLLPGHKGVDAMADWAHRLGKVVVQHQNHGGFDVYNAGADLIGAKGPFFADFVREKWNLPPEAVASTGCVQYDAAFRPEALHFSREEFCRLYGLDPGKRIAVWLPTRGDRQQEHYEWSAAEYRAICAIVTRSSNHNLIVKMHPADYASPYAPARPGADWAEALWPGAPVCRPEHAFACFHLCDVGLANWSTTGLEFSLFRRPFLYVDVEDNPRVQFLKQQSNLAQPIGFYLGTLVPGFVGQVCTSAELPGILETCSYDAADPAEYDEHTARFLTKADGKAYERVADLVERGLALAAARPNGASPAAVARLQLRVWAQEARRRLHAWRHA